ncbi:MAG: hypothetical protein JZD41_05265, partial [Thermoproteus sp.]|nr:hypothetical protein [Thermoproteus sp.]
MNRVKIVRSNVDDLPFMDPSIKWYVIPALSHLKIITGSTPATNSIQYSCDDAICVPRYYGGYM